MEQKKTLWIIAAVGVFLLVVLGGACIVYSPSKKAAQYTSNVKPTTEKQTASGWSNPPQTPSHQNNDFQRPDFNAPGAGKVNEMVVVSENTTVYDLNKNSAPAVTETSPAQSTTIDLNALKRELTAEVAAAANANAQPQNINITVTMPEKDTPIVVTSDYYTGKAQESATPKSTAPATTKPVEKKETTAVASAKPATTKPAATAKPAATTSTKPAATTATTATAKPAAPKTVTRYWVQVAAYANKKTAETSREVLTANKITSDIFTYQDAKGKLFYRVRVGPYTTKSEAEYWQAKINKIDDFKNSQSYVTTTNN